MASDALNSSGKARSARGEKARARLAAAALVVMERVGYHKMRITDVTAEAGVAAGLFYHYFKDLPSLTREVLEDFVSHSLQIDYIEKDVPRGDWYGRILAHNRLVIKSYMERPGIMRCMLQLADEDPEFSQLLRQNFIEQLHWLTRLMPRLFPEAGFGTSPAAEHQALMVVYTLAGMGETVLRDYFVNREPALLAEQLAVEEVAELLSVLYYRGLFLENPPQEQLQYCRNLHYMVRKP